MISRRHWILSAPALAAAPAPAAAPKNVVMASRNGAACCTVAMSHLQRGHDTLDAVIAGVNVNELDPKDTSVGYGGLPNELGIVELDASVMHGPTRRAGSVAALRNIKTPSKVAKLVMEQTDHIMLVGSGALEFAKAYGFQEENLLTEESRLAWLTWKRSLKDPAGHSNWTDGLDAPDNVKADLRNIFPDASAETLAWAWKVALRPPTGTINCLALNTKGEMSGCTTTSGMAWKLPGRVGDSPIIGAGVYVDQEVGAAGSTGRGEENMRVCGAHTIVENMRRGLSPKDACLDALKRVARNFKNDRAKLEQFDINFYALNKDGEYAAASLWNGFREGAALVPNVFTVNEGDATKTLPTLYLYERR